MWNELAIMELVVVVGVSVSDGCYWWVLLMYYNNYHGNNNAVWEGMRDKRDI